MRHIFAIGVMLTVLGCSGPTHYKNYLHPSYGQAEFDREWYACRKENEHLVTTIIGGVTDVSPVVDERMARSCLAARGWRQID